MKPVVCIVDRVYSRSKFYFDAAEDINFVQVGKYEAEIAKAIKDNNAAAVVIATDKYDSELYTSLPKSGLIARYGVGHDKVDKQKATENGLFVTITPGVLDNSVAEHAMFLIGTLARNISTLDASIKADKWQKSMGSELNGSTLLIIGCGNIGRRLGKIASTGFGMKVLGFDTATIDTNQMLNQFGIEMISSLDKALSQVNFISLHLPAIESTNDYINADFLAKLTDGTVLINTSRGNIIDENALYDELLTGRLSAGLDVFKIEPYQPQNLSKDLRNLPNIIMTPHISSSTENASKRMAQSVIGNIRLWQNKQFDKLDVVNREVLGR